VYLRLTPIGGRLDSAAFWLASDHGEASNYARTIKANNRIRAHIRGRWHRSVDGADRPGPVAERDRHNGHAANGLGYRPTPATAAKILVSRFAAALRRAGGNRNVISDLRRERIHFAGDFNGRISTWTASVVGHDWQARILSQQHCPR
jgi:hypothetical protein